MISKEEVKHIAKLARLELTDEEVIKMQKDLSAILDYFDLLKKAPKVKEGAGDFHDLEALRKDEVFEQKREVVEKIIAAAPDKKDDYIKVKSIM